MTCEDLLEKLGDFHLGELEEAESTRIIAHLASCSRCAAALRKLQLEIRTYREYAENVDRQLAGSIPTWRQFRRKLAAFRGRESRKARVRGIFGYLWHSPRWVAASLIMVLAVGAGYMLFNLREPLRMEAGFGKGSKENPAIGLASEPAGTAVGSEGKSLQQALLAIQKAEKEYLDAIRLLNSIIEKEKPRLDSRLWQEFEQSLRLIDANILATRAEYMARPSDLELALYMLAAYNRKVELLQEITS